MPNKALSNLVAFFDAIPATDKQIVYDCKNCEIPRLAVHLEGIPCTESVGNAILEHLSEVLEDLLKTDGK